MGGWSAPPYPNQQNLVLPNQGVNPIRNQQNFAQICGEILSENPDLDISDIQVKVNGIVRQIYDRRAWSSLMVRGQIATTGFTTGGSVNVTQGSPLIQGTGTNWTPAIIGQQFRLGFNTPAYNITGLDFVNQIITIEMPWASGNFTSAGYFIAQYYYSIGPSIKYIHTAKNMIMAWRLWLNYNQQTLDSRDPWRQPSLRLSRWPRCPRTQTVTTWSNSGRCRQSSSPFPSSPRCSRRTSSRTPTPFPPPSAPTSSPSSASHGPRSGKVRSSTSITTRPRRTDSGERRRGNCCTWPRRMRTSTART